MKQLNSANSIKTFGISLVIFMSVGPAWATPDAGLYVGATADANWGNGNYKTEQAWGYQYENKTPQNVVGGSVMGGYGWLIGPQYYLGVELGAHSAFSNAESWESITDMRYREQITPTVGVNASLRPGIYVNPNNLLYGHFGIGRTQYNDDSYVNDICTSTDQGGWGSEYSLGFGLDHSVSNDLALRIEYDYTFSSAFNLYQDEGKTNSLQPRYNTLSLGFIFS